METKKREAVIILCGGLGTRLKPLTDKYPKPLVPMKINEEYVPNLINTLKMCNYESREVLIVIPNEYRNEYASALSWYDVRIIINELSGTNNITSFKLALDFLKEYTDISGCYVIDGDTFITEPLKHCNTSLFFVKHRINEWKPVLENGFIKSFDKNSSGLCLTGISYWNFHHLMYLNCELSNNKLVNLKNEYWESFVESHLDSLSVSIFEVENNYAYEYDTISDLINIHGPEFVLSLIIPNVTSVSQRLDSMTNDNYLVELNDGSKYIVRIPGVGVEKYTHQDCEKLIYKELSNNLNRKITCDVSYIGNIKISSYIDNCHNWKSNSERHLIPKIVENLSMIHKITDTCDTNDYKIMNPISEIINYNSIVEESGCNLEMPKEFSELFGWISNIEFNIDCIVHGDLINSNVIVDNDNDEVVYLIDFEYVSLSNRNWDLGALLAEMSIYNNQLEDNKDLIDTAQFISNSYNNVSEVKTTKEDVILWCAIVHYVWSAWGYARTVLGDDEYEYANTRIKQCIRCINILKEMNNNG